MIRKMLVLLMLASAVSALAQSELPAEAAEPAKPQTATLPTGAKVLLALKNAVSTRTAKPGDSVYLQSTFPVVQDGVVVIPAGTFVQGEITSVKRPGRVKGRGELLMHFTTLIYPNGYSLKMPGALESSDSADTQTVKDKEGTVQAQGTKGKDAATIATTTGAGTLIGGLRYGGKGAGIGAGAGLAIGLLTTLLTRGDEVRFESGSSVEMVLQRPLTVDLERIGAAPAAVAPGPQRRSKPVAGTTNEPGLPLPKLRTRLPK